MTVKLAVFMIINTVPLAGEEGRFNVMLPLVFSIIRVPVADAASVCGEDVPVMENGVSTVFFPMFRVPVVVTAPGPNVTAPVDVKNVPDDAEKLILPEVTTNPEEPLTLPPTYKLPPIPAPPLTTKAPVVVEVAAVAAVIVAAVFVVNEVPERDIAPEVLVRFNAPVVRVKPFEAVKSPEEIKPPATVCAAPKVLIIKSALPPASRIV
jgi:hypothetical protein